MPRVTTAEARAPGGDGAVRRPRRRDIQGLRGLAVLLVVVFHAGLPVPGGFTGVDVFFAISGFVITTLLLTDLTAMGRIDLRRFYARRVKRLGPALAVMVATIALLGTLASPVTTQEVGATTGMFASVFSANAYLFEHHIGYFDPAATLNPFLHLWTLAVEEQFYLFFPALLLLGWWVGGRLRRGALWSAVIAVAVTTVVSFYLALELAGSGDQTHQQLAFFGSPTRAWEFGAGALLALLVPFLARMPRSAAQTLGALGLVAIGVAAFSIEDPGGFPVVATLLPVLGTCALLAAGTATGGVATRLLGIRPAVWIGDLSYSWYLWHWPLVVFATVLLPGAGWAAPTLAALSLLPAWLSYRYVENPIRFSPRIAGRTVLVLGAVCVAVPLAACVGLRATSDALAATAAMTSYERSQVPHLDIRAGCWSVPLRSEPNAACTWPAPERRGSVVLIGDSTAGQYSEPVLRAARRAGFELRIATIGHCPFVDLSVLREGRRHEMKACRRFYSDSLEAVLRLRPSLVITSARTDLYISQDSFGLAGPGGSHRYGIDEKQELWYQGVTSTLGRLNAAGIPVAVVHPLPIPPYSVADCAVVRLLTESCAANTGRKAVDRHLQRSVDTETRAVAGLPASWAIDFRRRLCDRDRCSGLRGDTLLYRDRFHLSVDGALLLSDDFHRSILAYARR
jgi:peptidoglycan/LPS O-acetylase OafA/YrhL